MNGEVIDYFEIPEELARELSELLTKQSIREKILTQIAMESPEKYTEFEEKLIPITAKVEAIKVKITQDYVPEKYSDDQYVWNYNGWEIDKNKIQILR